MKNKKGITLISLVITIVVLLILASIATYSGISVIKSSRLTAFVTELKIMQTQVNAIYENYDKKQEQEYGEDIDKYAGQAAVVFKYLDEDEKSGIKLQEDGTLPDGYKYWDKDYIKKKLGIEGVEQSFFVNIEERRVVSYEGFKYENTTYYTLSQFQDSSLYSLYNVDYEKPDEAVKPTFKVKKEYISNNKCRITVFDINYKGYINKWEVKYKLKDEESWSTSQDLSFVVSQQGTYQIKIGNTNIESEEETETVAMEYAKSELLLHYDGINNMGEGDDKHSTTTTIWKDLSGNGNDGTLTNFDNTEQSGWKSKGLKFDGQNDIVKTSDKFDFSTFQAGIPFSYGATITVRELTEQWYGIMTNMTVWGQGGFNIQYGLTQKIAIGMGQYVNSTTELAENTMYNIYAVYDGSVMKLYVNGKLENSMTYDIKPGSSTITIGYFYDRPSLPMNGEILNVKVYNKELTQNEIANNFEIDKMRFKIQE